MMGNVVWWLRPSRFNLEISFFSDFGTDKAVRMISLLKNCGFLILNILIVATLSSQPSFSADNKIIFDQSELSILSVGHKYKFKVEIAETEEQRARGLMYRKEMTAKNGMLFLFKENQTVNMWMKNTFIPLDIIFIDQKGIIIHIAKSTVPHSLDIISSHEKVVSALELNAGVTNHLKIQVGDKIEHPFFAP